MSSHTLIYQQAAALLEAGQTLEAERMMTAAVRNASTDFGDQSPEYAWALYELGRLLSRMGAYSRAAVAFRAACQVPATDDLDLKDRLSYLTSLGDVLLRLGELEEAETIVRDVLVEQAAIYGEQQVQYAHGLERLAELLRARGILDEALTNIEQAIAVLVPQNDPRAASGLALRAFIAQALGKELFVGLATLPPELFDELVTQVLVRQSREDLRGYLPVLQALQREVRDVRGEDAPWLVNIAATIADTAAHLEAHDVRLAALEWLLQSCEQRGEQREALDTLLGLALARGDAGQLEEAEETYRQAHQRAQELGDATVTSSVLREFGLFLSDHGRTDDAAEVLEASSREARAAQDPESLGRALIALGIFRQHHGALDEAQRPLEEALELLPSTHPDLLYAWAHLAAAVSGGSCGCGDATATVASALRGMLASRLPGGLLADVSVTLRVDRPPDVHLEVARQPNLEEAESLDQVVQDCLTALADGIRRLGYHG